VIGGARKDSAMVNLTNAHLKRLAPWLADLAY
jgi:hypothetical protein